MIELANLTLITTKNICSKNCPFCIAKSSRKIYNETIENKNEFLNFEEILTKTKSFKLAKNIKLDIALTNILKYDKFAKELRAFAKNYSNIKTIRLKELLCGKKDTSQTKWIKEHKLEKKIDIILDELLLSYKLSCKLGEKIVYENARNKLIYGASGDFKYYNNDFIISNNRLMNYNEEDIKIEEIHKLFENKICIN